jgi:hypothetical protein
VRIAIRAGKFIAVLNGQLHEEPGNRRATPQLKNIQPESMLDRE